MSYADCFAAALTENKRGILLTSDKEFKQVEKNIKIDFL
jgi:predicted nucleic acid-binding protein